MSRELYGSEAASVSVFGSYPPGGAATAAGAFAEAYREQFGAEGLEDTLAEYIKPTPILIPAFAAILRGETTPTGAESLTKDSLQTVFVHATRGLAAERTTIVLIDDLHFAPEDGRALFSSLAMAVPSHRVLLLGTMRPGVPQDWTANVTRLDHAEHRSLSRLGPKDLVNLLKDSFRSERLAHELGAQIAIKCDGNPFFAFEIIRGLREGQFISQRPDGTWVTTQLIQDIKVPSSVLDLVNARVADLTEEERNLLEVASCCGFQFDPDLVGEVLGMGPIPALQRLGRVEKKHRLVRSLGASYAFDHHQVQEALYTGLHDRLRVRYHAAIAEALAARATAADKNPKDLDGSLCVDLCEHFLKGAQGGQALRYLDAAPDHLGTDFLNDPAITLADRALAVESLLVGKARLDVLLKKNVRLNLRGRRAEQEAVLAEARALAEEGGDKALLAKVEQAAGSLKLSTGRPQQAKEHHKRHLAIAQEIGDRRGEANVTGNLGNVYYSLGRYDDAKEHHNRHLAIAQETGDRRGEATATGNLGNVYYSLGRYDEAKEHHKRRLAIVQEIGDRRGESTATGNLGNVYYSLGRYDDAKEHYKRHLAIAQEIGDRRGEANATGNLGNVCYSLGRYDDAKEHYKRHLAIAQEIGDRRGEANATGNLGNVYWTLGLYDEAQEHFKRPLAIAQQIGDRRGEATATGNLGSVYLRLGRYDEAKENLKRSLAIAQEIGDREGEARATGNLGRVHYSLGRLEKAKDHIEGYLAIAREMGDPLSQGHALSSLGSVEDEEGLQARAFDTVKEALKVRREMGNEEGVADSLMQLGDLHWRVGREGEARKALDEAVDLFRQQRRKPELAQALALLACLPGGDSVAAETALEDAGESGNTLRGRYHLWKATGKHEHLTEAKRLLDYRVEHAPEEYRESMLKNVRLNREIESAWKALHPERAARESKGKEARESSDPERAERVEGE